MSKPDDTDQDAVRLLSPLAGEPSGPARIDVARAMAEGGRRRRSRWWASGVAVVAVTATTAAGSTLAFSAIGRPAPVPRPIASVIPSISAAAVPAGPRDCTVTRLPTGDIRKAVVTGGDPSGRWLVGRTYAPGGGYVAAKPLVVWQDGQLAETIKIPGEDQTLRDINSLGVAVGASFQPDDPYPYAVTGGKATRLAGGAGGAQAINDAGVVVGNLGTDSQISAVRWSSLTEQPEDLPVPEGTKTSSASDIDEAGNILGAIGRKTGDDDTYLWLADGTGRRLLPPEVDGRKADAFWATSMRDGWVTGRAVIEAADGTSFAFFRYRIADDRYERLPDASGQPARVAANGWVLSEAERPVIIDTTGQTTVLPKYPPAKGRLDYIVSSFSDDGLVAAGYVVGSDLQNQPLLWRCR